MQPKMSVRIAARMYNMSEIHIDVQSSTRLIKRMYPLGLQNETSHTLRYFMLNEFNAEAERAWS